MVISADSRTTELKQILEVVVSQLLSFISRADEELYLHRESQLPSQTCLVRSQSLPTLTDLLKSTLRLPDYGTSLNGLSLALSSILEYSVNPSSPGFLDKLYSAPVAPGIAADLILSVLNTNLHVYNVSPVLTLVEKHVCKALCNLFDITGPRAGGISVQGGSASNLTSIVVARNTLFPDTKVHGNASQGRNLVMFTSAHGHYSIEKAAQACGFGSAAVIAVPVDPQGRMLADELERLIGEAIKEGRTPFYVNATAGTTVLGSFDPFVDVIKVAQLYRMWVHVDGAWGGSVAFSKRLTSEKLRGVEMADSIAINPHKMMGVPVTCSFLLGKDMKHFHDANTLPAGYLFHQDEDDEVKESRTVDHGNAGANGVDDDGDWVEPNDLADLTLQCGRRGDSLKLFLSWQYYGTLGYADKTENAHAVAAHMANLVEGNPNLLLVSQNPPPCLQVCFYYAPRKRVVFGQHEDQILPHGFEDARDKRSYLGKWNSKVTETVTRGLMTHGFMVDFAPALEGQEELGKFFRVVVNIQTVRETTSLLLDQVEKIGQQVKQNHWNEQQGGFANGQ